MPISSTLISLPKRLAAVLFVLLLSIAVHGQITPTDDSYIDTSTPTVNFGASKTLGVVSPSQTIYVTFDLSSIPSSFTGSSVAKASLKLYVNTVATAGSLNVDYVNGAWAEKTITANNAPPPGSTIAASIPLAKTQAHDYVLIDVTSAVVAWLNGTQANDGIAIVANSPLSATFDSKESTTQSHPAELDIVFASGGGGGTITGVLTGANSGLTGGGTSGTLNLSLLTSCASKQVLAWTGSAWACSSAGTGTITGVTPGRDMTGGGTSGNVTLNLDVAKVPELAAANTFTGNQTVNGNVSATGVVTGSSYQIGSRLFAFGGPTTESAFLGFAGNTTMTGPFNTGTGDSALSSNTSGSSNTASGTSALVLNTTGSSNTANGAFALQTNTTGGNNTAVGAATLFGNSTGSYNTALGNQALQTNTTGIDNSAVGSYALFVNGPGSENGALGYNALGANSTGQFNSAVGSQALTNNTTGSYNTAIGYFAGPAVGSNTLTNSTAIGALATVTASNSLVLGSINGKNGATADTSVGIGTTAPKTLLHVDHKPPAGGQDVVLVTSGGGGDVASLLVQNTGPGLRFRVGVGTDTAYLASSGGLKIFTGDTGTPNAPTGAVMTIDTSGNVHIQGNLSKGGGSFKIDHPLDPANKYLSHSFVESPDMMNIYNGNVVTDKRGLATIQLPEWFEALNRDFRYQLTVLRQFAQAIVVKEVSNHQFTIKTSKPGVKVSWQVTGIRQDPYANAYRIPLEEVKPAEEQGHYLHPELFGAGPERSVSVRAPETPVAATDQTAALASAGRTTQKQ